MIPPVNFICILLFLVFWLMVSIFLYSVGDVVKKPKSLPFGTFVHSKTVKYLAYYLIFALFWIMAFLMAAADFILSTATGFWYHKKSNSPVLYCFYSLFRSGTKYLFRYHTGSVAFGSLLVAIVWLLQVVLEFISVDNYFNLGKAQRSW